MALFAACLGLLASCSPEREVNALPYADEPSEELNEADTETGESATETGGPAVLLDGQLVSGAFEQNSQVEPAVIGCGFVVAAEGLNDLGQGQLDLRVVSRPGTDDEEPARITVVPAAADRNPSLPVAPIGDGEVSTALGDESGSGRQLLVMLGTSGEPDTEDGYHFRLDITVVEGEASYQNSTSFWVQSRCVEPPPQGSAGLDPVGDAGIFDDPEG